MITVDTLIKSVKYREILERAMYGASQTMLVTLAENADLALTEYVPDSGLSQDPYQNISKARSQDVADALWRCSSVSVTNISENDTFIEIKFELNHFQKYYESEWKLKLKISHSAFNLLLTYQPKLI